jgi:hypothetical protein
MKSIGATTMAVAAIESLTRKLRRPTFGGPTTRVAISRTDVTG